LSIVRTLFLNLALFLLVAAALLLVATGIAYPWRPQPPVGGALAAYAPARNGSAGLWRRTDSRNAPVAWASENVRILPTLAALGGNLRADVAQAILDEHPAGAAAAAAPLLQISVLDEHVRNVDGAIQRQSRTHVRTPRGEFLQSFSTPDGAGDLLFRPGFWLYPADLSPARTAPWSSAGTINGTIGYTATGRVIAAGPFTATLGAWPQCLQIEHRLDLTQADALLSRSSMRTWLCADLGAVMVEEFDAEGVLTLRSELISLDEHPLPAAAAALLPPGEPFQPVHDAAPDDLADPAQWTLTRFGRTWPAGNNAMGNVFAPVLLPTVPPLLLAAAQRGALTAFSVEPDGVGQARWQFSPASTIYGAPTYDVATGHIYFGASNGHLYALDANGLFLWSFAAADNIATRPLATADRVIFGSEDGYLYALDAARGAPIWTFDAGAPIVSSPVLASGAQPSVIFGADDGAVRALALTDGALRWVFATENAVEADPVVRDGVVYLGGYAAQVYALDAATGALRWRADLTAPVRTAAAVGTDAVYVVDEHGVLSALDRTTGNRVWRTSGQEYVGPPLLLATAASEALFAATYDGALVQFDAEGAAVMRWEANAATAATDQQTPSFRFGPTSGGGALWLADDSAVVRRLGPVAQPTVNLRLAWQQSAFTAPFTGAPLLSSAVRYGEDALLVDLAGAYYALEPATGAPRAVGTLTRLDMPVTIEPVVQADLLLTIISGTLVATDLAQQQERWRVTTGLPGRPPAVTEGQVLWLAAAVGVGDAPGMALTLAAHDLATGAEQWRRQLGGAPLVGGAVAHGDAVFTATPPGAFRLEDGAVRWRAALTGFGIGGPAVDALRHQILVGMVAETDYAGSIAALDLTTGAVNWQTSLPDGLTLAVADRVWVSGDVVVAPTGSGAVGLDAATGALRWRYDLPAPQFGLATVDGDLLWLMLEDGDLLSVDTTSGALAGRSAGLGLALQDVSFWQRPLVFGDRVIAPAGASVLGYGW
jgi:outer membrane protein assembly factor BamB